MQHVVEYIRQDSVKRTNTLLEFAKWLNGTKEIAEVDTSAKKHGVGVGVQLTARHCCADQEDNAVPGLWYL